MATTPAAPAPEFVHPVGDVDPSTPHLSAAPGGWRYDNVLTRVTARVEQGKLVCPLPRPSFTALELRQAFGLPRDFVERWAAANRAASAAAPADAPRLAPADGEAWWRYTTARAALRLAWPSADILVPDVRLFVGRATRRVVRVLAWPETVAALVVPAAVDYVVIRRDTLALRPGQERPGLIALDAALARLGPLATRFEAPVPHWLYRGGEAHALTIAPLRGRAAHPAGDFAHVGPDAVVDG